MLNIAFWVHPYKSSTELKKKKTFPMTTYLFQGTSLSTTYPPSLNF